MGSLRITGKLNGVTTYITAMRSYGESLGVNEFNTLINILRFRSKEAIEFIKSCFGDGRWLSDKPWNNEDCWKN